MAEKKARRTVKIKKPVPRKRVPKYEEMVLRKCRRQCCMCFGLRGITDVKDGQIVHLDRKRSNTTLDNLAFLCLECHKAYDTKSNRVKAFTPGEIRYYRDLLYRKLGQDQIKWEITLTASRDDYDTIKAAVNEAQDLLLRYTSEVTLSERPVT